MSIPPTYLMQGETIVHQTNLRWEYAFSATGGLTILGLCLLPFGIGPLFLVVAALTFPFDLINYKTSRFAVTNKRVLIKTGLIKRRSLELLLNKIEGIYFEQDLIQRMNKAGHLILVGTGGTKEILPHVNEPLVFKNVVQQEIEKINSKSA